MKPIKCIFFVLFSISISLAQENKEDTYLLFTNVNIWDGTAEKLKKGNVLIKNNRIEQVKANINAPDGATIIDGKGGTLMPGLIDAHVHFMMNADGGISAIENNNTWEDLAIRSVKIAEMYLMEGFTTVRDMGGANAGLRRAIDEGGIIGPRFYSSGAFIGGRGGHADFANYSSQPGDPTQMKRLNMAVEVAGADEVIAAARNNFRLGATQIKIMQTGGVASLLDPWQLNGMTEDEIKAAVEIADSYGSYVGAHSYSSDAIMRALDLGVKTIEHGFMFDDAVNAKMIEKGAYITTNLTAFSPLLAEVSALQDPRNQYKLKTATEAFSNYIDNVKRLKPKRGFQTDCVGSAIPCQAQNAYEKYLGGEFFGNYETLKSLTSTNGEIMALSGTVVNPYPYGKLGVIEEGAYADILIVDGNPLEDLSVIGANPKWFDAEYRPNGIETIKIIMKDGVIYKNTLD